MENTAMHVRQTLTGDSGDGFVCWFACLEMVRAINESLPLTGENRCRVVVALLEHLDHLSPCCLQTLGIEGGESQHVQKQGKTLIKITLQTVHRGRGSRFTSSHTRFCCQKIERLVKLRCWHLLRASFAHQSGRHGRQTGYIRRVQRGTAFKCYGKSDQRKLVRWC